jgi:hypothetical protein
VTAGGNVELGGAEGRVVFPWTDDGLGVIAARAFEATRFFTFAGRAAAAPRLSKAVQRKDEREQYPCKNQLIYPEAWARLGSGDVMVFSGQLCGVPGKADHARSLGVERLRVGHVTGEVALLPVPDEAPASTLWSVVASAAISPTRVLVALDGSETEPPHDTQPRRFTHLARWDGATWRTERSPLATIAGLWALYDRFAATDSEGGLWLEQPTEWLAVEWITDDPSSEPWSRGAISQVAAADGALWLVHEAEVEPGAVVSRVYRLELP